VAAGFALAGLRGVEASSPQEAADRLRGLRGEAGVGVILLQDSLYDGLPDDARREFGRRPLPMVVPFPGPAWALRPREADAYIVELLRQVVGYRVRLK
jgi:vacuolar-type H+-ATPase subunit F/Vma7